MNGKPTMWLPRGMGPWGPTKGGPPRRARSPSDRRAAAHSCGGSSPGDPPTAGGYARSSRVYSRRARYRTTRACLGAAVGRGHHRSCNWKWFRQLVDCLIK